MRNKVDYTDLAFNLLPKRFTLTELQQVYELILGKELLTPAFRRKIADQVIAQPTHSPRTPATAPHAST
jgi:hypothetical protein